MRSRHEKQKLFCTECDKTFTRQFSLNRHCAKLHDRGQNIQIQISETSSDTEFAAKLLVGYQSRRNSVSSSNSKNSSSKIKMRPYSQTAKPSKTFLEPEPATNFKKNDQNLRIPKLPKLLDYLSSASSQNSGAKSMNNMNLAATVYKNNDSSTE